MKLIMREKHNFLIEMLSKVSDEMSEQALVNLLNNKVIGKREYNKLVISIRNEKQRKSKNN